MGGVRSDQRADRGSKFDPGGGGAQRLAGRSGGGGFHRSARRFPFHERHRRGNSRVNDLGLTDLYEAAARATINERCAPAYLHDVRGSLQALFGALELLGRSARAGGGDLARVEKACDLARRAISRHEKSTIDTLQVLTSQQTMATAVEIGALTRDVVHFLRNDAGNRAIRITVAANSEDVYVWADRAKLQTVLAGLLTAAIDEAPAGGELPVTIDHVRDEAAVSIGSH